MRICLFNTEISYCYVALMCASCCNYIISTFIVRKSPLHHRHHPPLLPLTSGYCYTFIVYKYKVTFTPGCKSLISQQYYYFLLAPAGRK